MKEQPICRVKTLEMAEWAQNRLIDKACEWIRYNNENGGCLFDGWEKDFRKMMEE